VPLQNPAYRAFLKVPDNDVGARIDYILPIPSTLAVLRTDDVILRIGNFPVASDGTILYEGNRVSAALATQSAQAGESVPLKIWRNGKEMDVSLPMNIYDANQARGHQYDPSPRYYVYGGLVMTPLNLNYLQRLGGSPGDSDKRDLFYELYYRRDENPSSARKEPVVLSSVLADDVNANFGVRGRILIDRINGKRINQLEDAIAAFETNTNTYDIVEFWPDHAFECLNHAGAVKAKSRILETYAVPSDRQL
jgi:hypothetical protein